MKSWIALFAAFSRSLGVKRLSRLVAPLAVAALARILSTFFQSINAIRALATTVTVP
jgi:hypothetical protein